jgi:Carboxypeptidase regulatory-like domain
MFESMRCGCAAAVRQSNLGTFQKRHAFARKSLEAVVSRQFGRCFRAILVCAVLLLALANSKAQSGGATGTIVGTVVDSSGALIANAQVSITEADTNVTSQTTTSSLGSYTVASLKPGTYRVTVVAKGFSTTTVQKVELAVGSEARVDLKLATGSEQQTVSVNAEAASLDTENGAIGQLVTGQEIVDLPLNGRNFTQLLLLNSGAVSNSGEQGSFRANEGNALTIQGARPESNQYFLDGININDTYYQTPAVVPSIDILQEFQEQTKGYSAAYGGGANQINLSTRSGANLIHGTAYDFFRNDALDAKGYFATGKNPPLRQNQFGYVLSGPIVIPHIYDGHNRSFFLANYEGLRSKTSSVIFANVPTAAEKAGQFSVPIVNPFTKVPFAGNTIPQSAFSKLALNSLSHFPDPNISSPQGNYTTVLSLPINSDQQTYRFDQSIGTRDSVFVRYTQTAYKTTAQSSGGVFAEGLGIFSETSKTVVGSWTHTFSPRLLNQARFGYLSEAANLVGVPTTPAAYDALGLENIYPYNVDIPYPLFSFRNAQYSTAGGAAVIQEYNQQPYSISDAVTWNVRSHTISFGMDVRWWHTDQNNPGPPQFTFDGSGTGVPLPGGGTVTGTGDPFADYLTGYVAQATALTPTAYAPTVATSNQVAYSFRYFAPWIQDDWKVSQKLTINAGLRYDFNRKPVEDLDRVFWIDPNIAGGGLYTANKSIIDKGIGGSLYAYGGEHFPGPSQVLTFAPRLGFAYRPTANGKTVVRAGYGIFYDTTETKEADDGGGYPYGTQSSLMNVNSANLFPATAALAPVTSAQLGFLFIQTARTHTPYLQDYQLSVEREIFTGWKAEADYLGSKGTHLLGRVWENAPTQYNPANPTPVSARVPFPNIGLILDHFYDFYSNYNAMQAKLEHSGSNYSAILSYTYSHSLDDKSSEAGINGDTSGNGPQNQYDFNADYSSSSFDITHNFVGSFTANLPFGRGKHFLDGSSRALDTLVGGWQVNGIVSLRTGFPFSIAATDIGFLNQAFGQRADVAGNPNPGGVKRTVNQWFSTTSFVQPGIGEYGNSSRDIVRAPGVENVDASLFKNISLVERLTLQTRFEAFNLFNHTNLGFPDNSISSPTYGAINSAAAGRILQVAMKIIW